MTAWKQNIFQSKVQILKLLTFFSPLQLGTRKDTRLQINIVSTSETSFWNQLLKVEEAALEGNELPNL